MTSVSLSLLRSRPLKAMYALAIGLASLGTHAAAVEGAAPEEIFLGRFLTLDRSHPRAEAIAVSGDRIVALGSEREMERLAGAGTRVRVPGVALPGLSDAHVHVEDIGEELERVNLRGLSKAQILAKVERASHAAAAGEWIRGEGWDEGFWRPAVFPRPGELEAVSAGHPVVLERIDGHSTWVNNRVLALAGISRGTPDPDGGKILRDDAGEATGVLVDKAQDLIQRVIPQPTRADRERRVRVALAKLSQWGLTSVHDASVDLDGIAIYKELLERGELPLRVYVLAEGERARAHYLSSGPERDLGRGMLAVRSFKLFLDGALGSRGAELSEPYSDAPTERGLELLSDAELARIVSAARAKGFQIATHAIGDRAVSRALDAFEKGGVTPDERFRIEHASVVTDEDVERIARLGVIASVQPVFVGEYSRWAQDRVGPNRARWVLRTRDFLAAGARVASGSDYPASDSGTPVAALHCLVTRQSAAGQPPAGWYGGQRIDVEQALRVMTEGPAYAAFQEADLGTLSIGRHADFTALSADPYAVPHGELRGLRVLMTVVAGRVRFEAGANASLPALPRPEMCGAHRGT